MPNIVPDKRPRAASRVAVGSGLSVGAHAGSATSAGRADAGINWTGEGTRERCPFGTHFACRVAGSASGWEARGSGGCRAAGKPTAAGRVAC